MERNGEAANFFHCAHSYAWRRLLQPTFTRNPRGCGHESVGRGCTSRNDLRIGAAHEAVAQNVLTNPGFEAGLTGWTAFASPVVLTDPHRRRLHARSAGAGAFTVPVAFQSFPATAGQIWDLQAYYLRPNAVASRCVERDRKNGVLRRRHRHGSHARVGQHRPVRLGSGIPWGGAGPSIHELKSDRPVGPLPYPGDGAHRHRPGQLLRDLGTMKLPRPSISTTFRSTPHTINRHGMAPPAAWSSANWSTPNFPNNGNGGTNYDATINSGTVTLESEYRASTISRLTGGTVTAASNFTLTVNDQMTWNGGTMSGSGQTRIASERHVVDGRRKHAVLEPDAGQRRRRRPRRAPPSSP